MIGIVGILIALGLLIFLSFRGMSVLLLAPAMAVVAVVLSGAPLLASYTQVFMPAMGGFVVHYFPLFLLGALFGKLMNDTGSARALAETIAQLRCRLAHRSTSRRGAATTPVLRRA